MTHRRGYKIAARTFVLLSNRYWPFSRLNKLPYDLAIETVARGCRVFPQVLSLYVRHGLSRPDWVPGISDIDFTVVIDSGMTAELEFEFLGRFWVWYSGQRKTFPMLGEVMILSEDKIDVWTRFTVRGLEARDWKLVYGRGTVVSAYIEQPHKVALDGLNHAVLCYWETLLPMFYADRRFGRIQRAQMQRLVRKIDRYSEYGSERKDRQVCESPCEFQLQALRCMADGIGSKAAIYEKLDSLEKNLGHIYKPNIPRAQAELFTPGAGKLPIASIMSGYEIKLVVLEEQADEAGLDRLRRVLMAEPAVLGRAPLLVTAVVLQYLLEVFHPFLYWDLMNYGKILYGENVLKGLRAPSREVLQHRVLEHIIEIATAYTAESVYSSKFASWLGQGNATTCLKRALFLRMVVEEGGINLSYDESLASARQRHADLFAEFEGLQNQIARAPEERLRSRVYCLLKDLADYSARLIRGYRHEGSYLQH